MAFNPQATKYTLDNAILLGGAAAVSYSDRAACEKWARDNGFDGQFDFFSSQGQGLVDTQGFIAQNRDTLLVAFRGTEPKKPLDWLVDAKFVHKPWDHAEGKVHEGFGDGLRSVWGPGQGDQILPKRLRAREDSAVWITGHSLGGALAEMCAAQAAFVGEIPVQAVYTFGQPRLGDEVFAKLLNTKLGSRIFRHINDRDIVPRVPLFLTMGFRHYGGEVFFDHEQKTTHVESALEDVKAAFRLFKTGLTLDAGLQVGKEIVGQVLQHLKDPSKDPLKALEDDAIPILKRILASGTENIADHNMQTGYLARLGVKAATAD